MSHALLPSPFVVAGPTASGKSSVAVALARRIGRAHIVNADPYQAWQHMPVLTAQPAALELETTPHHLYACLAPDEDRDAAGFAALVRETLAGLATEDIPALVVSGSGLYLRAIFGGIDPLVPAPDADLRATLETMPLPDLLAELATTDPEEFSRIDQKNPRRVIRAVEICRLSGQKASSLRQSRDQPQERAKIGVWLDWPVDTLKSRIRARAASMLGPALAAELDALAELPLSRTAAQTLGLATARAWHAGKLSHAAATNELATLTWQYAKRQRTWFRKAQEFFPIPVQDAEPADSIASRIIAAFPAALMAFLGTPTSSLA